MRHPLQPDELVREPRDGVGLAAPRAVLHEIARPDAPRLHVREQPPHDVELVVAREDLLLPLAPRGGVRLLHDLRVVLDNVRERLLAQDLPPEVVRHRPRRVRRIARPAVAPLVEREEPRALPRQARAEEDARVVHREVRDAALEREERLGGRAVAAVLLHRVPDALPREAVLELAREDRQPVHEDAQVQREPRRVARIAQLARHAEEIFPEQLPRRRVLGRRRRRKEEEAPRIGLHALAQDVHHAAPRHFRLHAVQELLPRAPRRVRPDLRQLLRLRLLEEAEELRRVERPRAVVVRVRTLLVARLLDEGADDQVLKAFLGRVGDCHCSFSKAAGNRIIGQIPELLGLKTGRTNQKPTKSQPESTKSQPKPSNGNIANLSSDAFRSQDIGLFKF